MYWIALIEAWLVAGSTLLLALEYYGKIDYDKEHSDE